MKVKGISKLLIFSVLFSNLNMFSFAGTLSDDRRSESFIGTNVEVNEILSDDTISNINIKGDTLVNLFDGFNWLSDATNVIASYNNRRLMIKAKDGFTGSIGHSYFGKMNLRKKFMEGRTYTMYFRCNIGGSEFGIRGTKGVLSQEGSDYKHITSKGENKFVFTINENVDNVENFALRLFEPLSEKNNTPHIIDDIVILEGEAPYDYVPYFEGMKSIGEDGNIEIVSESKEYRYSTIKSEELRYDYYLDNNLPSETTITNTTDKAIVLLHYNAQNPDYWIKDKTLEPNESYTIEDGLVVRVITFYTFKNWNNENIPKYLSDVLKIGNAKSSKTKINIGESLNSIPDVATDRIIEKNGKLMIERNCKKVELNGSEDWIMVGAIKGDTRGFYTRDIVGDSFETSESAASGKSIPVVSEMFNPTYLDWYKMTSGYNNEFSYTAWDGNLCFSIFKDRLPEESVNGVKLWLSQNRPKMIYKLATPEYEYINIYPSINIFEGGSYVTVNGPVATEISFDVDRTINRAVEAINVAENNPTIDNISQARYWINLMKETIKKDELQNIIDNITLENVETEKKKVSANIDVYVKSKNSLTMSLDTNNIVFDGYSNTNDLEKLGALNITINSSLPYDLNAYLPQGITNSDNVNAMPPNTINIRDNTETNYTAFSNTIDKVVLKSNCEAGDNKNHSIDFKISAKDSYKADVYKAVIMFEAEQK